ncbi:MAG: methylated-DNA--[protein]-cysteine S-methyltransferase [Rhodospirillales bacterium]|nr:methylated-DNA--[protein]-cysteine S-methyltransferase [Rhodospirillales bacterium]MCB9973417.1 methylated-DNA--[protein]-cysteine S-methyltransferase [Rhodospirillales bacterium]MCB9980420.1 methylated-DNA--[protein]-cysteine S-methyltransferase [Rhodospirillales bacterium]
MKRYDTMACAVDYLVAHPDEKTDLTQLASMFHLDPTVFQKQFQSYVGVSPKQLQRFLMQRQAREFLLEGYSTLEAAYAAGLSGNGRLHETCVTIEAATPGEIKAKGRGMTIICGWQDTPFGAVLIGETARGICWLAFEFEGGRSYAEERLQQFFPYAQISVEPDHVRNTAIQIGSLWRGTPQEKIRLNLYGTNFQLQVWQALLRIPHGACVSYGAVAEFIGTPKACRAVGSAVGANPVSFIIPCHRVIQQSGIVENYGWGSPRKKALLGLEVAQQNAKNGSLEAFVPLHV